MIHNNRKEKKEVFSVARTLLTEGVYGALHDTCDCIQLIHLVNFLLEPSCLCQCRVVSSVHVGASHGVFAIYE